MESGHKQIHIHFTLWAFGHSQSHIGEGEKNAGDKAKRDTMRDLDKENVNS
jgi:hypothetical protein